MIATNRYIAEQNSPHMFPDDQGEGMADIVGNVVNRVYDLLIQLTVNVTFTVTYLAGYVTHITKYTCNKMDIYSKKSGHWN